jgi:hypothetical protein
MRFTLSQITIFQPFPNSSFMAIRAIFFADQEVEFISV